MSISKSLTALILEDNLEGLRGFLENRNVNVDERDDVRLLGVFVLSCCSIKRINFLLTEWIDGVVVGIGQRKNRLCQGFAEPRSRSEYRGQCRTHYRLYLYCLCH